MSGSSVLEISDQNKALEDNFLNLSANVLCSLFTEVILRYSVVLMCIESIQTGNTNGVVHN
jgi:hypothetical protein